MKKRDLNEIAKIEKAIKEKYGEQAIQNPKKLWNEEKEKQYLEELKDFYGKPKTEKKIEERPGFILKQRGERKEQNKNCPVCGSYSTSSRDDLYMLKFQCCFDCYVQYVEDREERWKTGWRPIS